jgi:carbon storage regulator
MLILSRKIGEAIIIADEIEIRVLAIKGQQVKIGIDAPQHYEIFREELWLEIQEERENGH